MNYSRSAAAKSSPTTRRHITCSPKWIHLRQIYRKNQNGSLKSQKMHTGSYRCTNRRCWHDFGSKDYHIDEGSSAAQKSSGDKKQESGLIILSIVQVSNHPEISRFTILSQRSNSELESPEWKLYSTNNMYKQSPHSMPFPFCFPYDFVCLLFQCWRVFGIHFREWWNFVGQRRPSYGQWDSLGSDRTVFIHSGQQFLSEKWQRRVVLEFCWSLSVQNAA